MALSPTIACPLAPSALSCRVCESRDVEKEGAKKGDFVKEEFEFYKCRDCEFRFVEPVTSFRIYDNAYYSGQGADPLVNYEEEYLNYAGTPRRFEFANLLRFATEHLERGSTRPPQGSVAWLDFGCGAGGLLKYLRDAEQLACCGHSVRIRPVGHDVGSYSERLKNVDGFEILDWDELRTTCVERFDIISCIEVLEHIPYPRPVLELLARCLKPGGLLILTTGNLDSPLARWQGIRFSYCTPEIHVSLFNPPLLARLYHETGLTPIYVKHDGTIKFRIIKVLLGLPGGKFFKWLASLPPVVWLADYLFGVSKMPFAVKGTL